MSWCQSDACLTPAARGIYPVFCDSAILWNRCGVGSAPRSQAKAAADQYDHLAWLPMWCKPAALQQQITATGAGRQRCFQTSGCFLHRAVPLALRTVSPVCSRWSWEDWGAALWDADPALLMSGSKGGLKIFLLLLTSWKQIPGTAWLLWYLECMGLMEILHEIWRHVGCTSLVSLHNT